MCVSGCDGPEGNIDVFTIFVIYYSWTEFNHTHTQLIDIRQMVQPKLNITNQIPGMCFFR